ncbi:glycosyltransferase family 2 protein [Patescibacteria group bacterium]|nr:glycosyltransferase family 2 protein [Patescibacteria group bacterium]
MNQAPKISVIMCAYNEERHIDEAIQSILKQSFSDFEFIIVDDCSTDKTSQIIKRYKDQDQRIIVLTNENNLGLAGSKNRALGIAKGKYIAIMDADDISLPERLQLEYNYLESHPDIFLVGSSLIILDDKDKEVNRTKPPCTPEAIARELPKNNFMAQNTILFRRQPGIKYRKNMCIVEDYDFYLRLLTDNKKLANLSEPLVKYRLTSESVSLAKRPQQALLRDMAKNFYWQRVKTGHDEYDCFDSDSIINIDLENSTDKFILKELISASFRINDFNKVRLYCKKFFHHYGIFNKTLIYYLASFLPKSIVNLRRKISS